MPLQGACRAGSTRKRTARRLEGILAGAMRIKLWHYMAGTLIGMTPGVLATSVFGEQITRALEDPSTINWWLVAAVFAAFAALTYAVRRWFATH